ncbi:MAG: hypothetical protein H6742_13770 [Alphaproteobacteria bacterium]|nr:hypothetical protein [Alphaproteobacteria bacterium]
MSSLKSPPLGLTLLPMGLGVVGAIALVLWVGPDHGTAGGASDATSDATAALVARIRADRAALPPDDVHRLPLRAQTRPHPVTGDRGLPPPTENWLSDDAEVVQKKARKEWIERRHRAPDGVDWKAIERGNGMAQTDRRRAGAAGLPAGATAVSYEDGVTDGVWVERGSENQAGRIHVATISRDGHALYAGSSKGGVWKLDLDSDSWSPIADDVYGGAHWLQTLPGAADGDPDVIVTSTDWGYVNVSTDEGASWTQSRLEIAPNGVRRLAATQDGRDALFIVTSNGVAWSLQRSTDGGESFQAVVSLGAFAGDVFVPRDGGEELFLATSDGVQRSLDLGETWELMGPLPVATDDVRLAGSEARRARADTGDGSAELRLWAVTDSATLWRSDDAGRTWVEKRDVRSDFWGRLVGSQVDEDLALWGGLEVWRTEDGGDTATQINAWWDYYERPADRLHADLMGLETVVGDDGRETIYIGTDGGLFRSTDGAHSVENLSLDGLRVGQYYGTFTHRDDATRIAAGAQDQGYQLATELAEEGRYDFDQVISGDYAQLVSGDGSLDLVYSVYPGFILVQIGEDASELGYVDYPTDEAGRYFAWLPPLHADTADPSAFWFCATKLYKYTYGGGTWTPTRWSDQDFALYDYEFLSAFALAPSDPSRGYATTSYGRLFTSDDGGVTWTESRDTGPYSHYFHGTALVIDPDDPDTAWIGGSGYDGDAVYRTTDGGETWQGWGDGLPSTLVTDLALATDGSKRLFAAAETAAYVRGGDSTEWVDITGLDAPITTYWSVEAVQSEHTMRFGTYGRGIWDYQYEPWDVPPDEEEDSGGSGGDDPSRPDDDPKVDCGGCAVGGGGGVGRGALGLLPVLLLVGWRRRREGASATR